MPQGKLEDEVLTRKLVEPLRDSIGPNYADLAQKSSRRCQLHPHQPAAVYTLRVHS